jgi:hypothetical protein
MLAVACIGMWISFDRLADIERSEFREAWIADGRPYGGREARQEASLLGSGVARMTLLIHWIDAVPTWARQHVQALRHLRRLRLFNALAMIGLLVALVGSILRG